MAASTHPLDVLRIASPCDVSWDGMSGDERVRFCAQCRLHVYNLSEMSRSEAEDLVWRTEGRLCVRFYRRSDGRIMTQDCPAAWRVARRQLRRLVGAVVLLLTLLSGVALFAGLRGRPVGQASGRDVVQTVRNWLFQPTPGPCEMGWRAPLNSVR
jgi:hypothetical protein